MRVDGTVELSSPATDAVLAAERLLVLFPGYSAPSGSEPFADATMVGNAFARLLAMVRRPATRDHVRFYRDFYANPRSPAYMAERLRALFGSGEGRRRTLVLDPKLDGEDATAGWAGDIHRSADSLARSPGDLAEQMRAHDAVLLLHSDALGLGLGALERRLVGAFPAGVFVLNGRRRLYRLDARMQRRLRRRRVLAETRIVEAALARVVPILAWLLAGFDRFASRKPT